MSGMRQTGLIETLGESSRVGLLLECSLEGLRWGLCMGGANDLIKRFFFLYLLSFFLKVLKVMGCWKKVILQLEFFIFLGILILNNFIIFFFFLRL